MKSINLKDSLLMKEDDIPKFMNPFQLQYEPVETEGECILKTIIPVKISNFKFILFCVLSVLFLGIPVVLAYWYPKFKLWCYYDQCNFIEATHFSILNYDNQTTIAVRKQQILHPHTKADSDIYAQASSQRVIYFINRYMKYRLIESDRQTKVKADIFEYEKQFKRIIQQNYQNKKPITGYQQNVVQQLRERFGPGSMIIQRPGIFVLFIRQIVQPLYFFLVFTMLVWISEQYYYYCTVIFITTTVGCVVNLYQTYKLNHKIFDMAYYVVNVNVLRGDRVVNISSLDVVPGDIVFLNEPIKIPFDGIVLENSALLNQSALTGQSVPVVRKAEDLSQLAKSFKKDINFTVSLKSNLICEGTTLIQVDSKKTMQIFEQYRKQFGVPVFVIRTNFVTLKGQLIRIISFPIQKTNIFEKQSSYFLLFLFIVTCVSYGILVLRLYKFVQWNDMLQKFLDLITVTVPPGLPVSMTFGIIHAIDKLKKKDIYCVSPNKVIMGGLVDFICFDKTGTLTQDFMDFRCIVPSSKGQFQNQIQNPLVDEANIKSGYSLIKLLEKFPNVDMDHILTNMATNHTITNIIKTGENFGDPMELKLFQFGQYRFNDQIAFQKNFVQQGEPIVFGFESSRGHCGAVLRRMDFDSDLLRMSAIAKSSIKQDPMSYYLYTKGSPESILKICNLPTIPKNYQQILKYYASSGYRVLGICHRKLENSLINQERELIERDMIFDGFQIFENKLKPETKGALRQLTMAMIPCVMITGDNVLTGCNMAYRSGIVSLSKKINIFNYKQMEREIQNQQFRYEPTPEEIQQGKELLSLQQQGPYQIQLKNISSPEQITSTLPKNNNKYLSDIEVVNKLISQIESKLNNPYNQICLTGSAFNLLFNGIDLSEMDQKRKNILKSTKVYARAKPNEKARIIMAYQQGLGKVVAMCGDGANDCGALKQSDAGLSLSQTQASISAPFTSKIANIGSMVQLIKQCRAGLVTNFSLFNIMALYSLIQYTSSVISQYYFTYPTDFQFLYWDLFGNFFFFLVFGYTQTADHLTKEKPSRSLFTLMNLTQVAMMHFIQLIGQFLMIFSLSRFFSDEINYPQNGGAEVNYKKYVENNSDFVKATVETSILFLFSNFMYIFSFIAFSISKPWRKQFYTNIPFMVIFVLVFTYSILVVIYPPSRIPQLYIVFMDHPLVNLFILLSALIFGSVMYINQKCVLEPIMTKLRLAYPEKLWL